MTTLTVQIDKDKDLSALKDFIGQLGLNYEVEVGDAFLYTDGVKIMLDKRYRDYQDGLVEMVNEEQSRKRIRQILGR